MINEAYSVTLFFDRKSHLVGILKSPKRNGKSERRTPVSIPIRKTYAEGVHFQDPALSPQLSPASDEAVLYSHPVFQHHIRHREVLPQHCLCHQSGCGGYFGFP